MHTVVGRSGKTTAMERRGGSPETVAVLIKTAALLAVMWDRAIQTRPSNPTVRQHLHHRASYPRPPFTPRHRPPDQNGIWIVQSSCLTLGCLAHVVISRSLTDFGMMFDSAKWDRLAVPQIGTCNGAATVRARSAHEFLVPQGSGSLTGALTLTVDCNGTSVDFSQPLSVSPPSKQNGQGRPLAHLIRYRQHSSEVVADAHGGRAWT